MLVVLRIRSEVLRFVLGRSLQSILACMLCSKVLMPLPSTHYSRQCPQSCARDSQASLSFMESQILLSPGKRPFSVNSVKEHDFHTLGLRIFGYPTSTSCEQGFIYPIIKCGWPVNWECLCWGSSFTVSTHKDLSGGNRHRAGVSGWISEPVPLFSSGRIYNKRYNVAYCPLCLKWRFGTTWFS